jgi:hypothetical protein
MISIENSMVRVLLMRLPLFRSSSCQSFGFVVEGRRRDAGDGGGAGGGLILMMTVALDVEVMVSGIGLGVMMVRILR